MCLFLKANHWVFKRRHVFYWRGRVISKYFTNWEGSNLFYRQPGEGHFFFGKEKNYSMSVSWLLLVNKHAKCIETQNLYIQANLPVKINLNYLIQVSKYYVKKLSCPNCSRFRPYFDGGNVCASGSGIKSIFGDDSLLELLENSIYYITFRVSVSSFWQNLHSWPFLSWHAVMWANLPVSYFHFRLFLSWRRWGEGQILFLRCLLRVMH